MQSGVRQYALSISELGPKAPRRPSKLCQYGASGHELQPDSSLRVWPAKAKGHPGPDRFTQSDSHSAAAECARRACPGGERTRGPPSHQRGELCTAAVTESGLRAQCKGRPNQQGLAGHGEQPSTKHESNAQLEQSAQSETGREPYLRSGNCFEFKDRGPARRLAEKICQKIYYKARVRGVHC